MFASGVSKNQIAEQLKIRKQTIISWLAEEEYTEGRGWNKNQKRKHSDVEEQRIITLKQTRIESKKYFVGAPFVQMDYSVLYPLEPQPWE